MPPRRESRFGQRSTVIDQSSTIRESAGREAMPHAKAIDETSSRQSSRNRPGLEHTQLLLFLQFLRLVFFRGGLNRLGLLGAGARIDVTGLDVDEGVFAQSREISAQSGL